MAPTTAKSEAFRRLADVLEEGRPWTVEDSLRLVRKLAAQVQVLHQSGRTHRAISAETVLVDSRLRPQLSPPALSRRFGGNDSDPEFCPPELAGGSVLELPLDLQAAAAVLKRSGREFDPRRIDVYQLGALLCRLIMGESIRQYVFSPVVKARVPAAVRPLLETALGHDCLDRLFTCEQLLAALDEAFRQANAADGPASTQETPAQGSVIVPGGDTPPHGSQPASAPFPAAADSGELPFARLGHYRVLGRIGRGGMGDVYRGYDESLEREVAIKVLPSELARDEDYVRRFHAEAKAAAKVAHPNVVPVYYSGEDAGHHFFAMQFVEGESLSQRMQRHGRLPVDETLQIVAQCLAGLQAAHDHGLIHRDVKPGNVLLDRKTGRALLVDFGLARRMGAGERVTATGTVMGTVDCIAPEQARGQEVDGRADIYSLGVMTYQFLSGRLPFVAATPTAMIFQHAYEDPFPLDQAAPDLPQPVIDIVTRMMAKAAGDRYASCAEVLADIRAYREGRAPAPVEPEAGGRPSAVPPAPGPSWESELPTGLDRLADHRRLRGARDWLATVFRRHAPEFVQNLQSTTQQVDGAVAEYERRCNRLAGLREEARSVAAELAQQLQENVAALAVAAQMVKSAGSEEEEQAALAKKQECEENVEVLRTQHGDQQQQLEEIEHQWRKAEATLARLRSQRDVLKARLRAAEAGKTLDVARPQARRLTGKRLMLASGVLAAIVVVALLISRFGIIPRRSERSAPGDVATLVTPGITTGKVPPAVAPWELPPDAPLPAVAPFDAAAAKKHQEAWGQYLGVPVEQDIDLPGGETLTMVLIPPSEFLMGSTAEEQARILEEAKRAGDPQAIDQIPRERPQHRVRITRPFYLGKYEVTQAQWEALMGGNPSDFTDDPSHPVGQVSWDEVQQFLAKLNEAGKAQGMKFGLPTEAQWEYACRAGTTTFRHCGDDNASLQEYAWFAANSDKMHPVGQLRPNGFGLHDMHGNVAEWCADLFAEDYYAESPLNDPSGPGTGSFRVFRGGAWMGTPRLIRSARRMRASPDSHASYVGFRLVCCVPAEASSQSSPSIIPSSPVPEQANEIRVRRDQILKGLSEKSLDSLIQALITASMMPGGMGMMAMDPRMMPMDPRMMPPAPGMMPSSRETQIADRFILVGKLGAVRAADGKTWVYLWSEYPPTFSGGPPGMPLPPPVIGIEMDSEEVAQWMADYRLDDLVRVVVKSEQWLAYAPPAVRIFKAPRGGHFVCYWFFRGEGLEKGLEQETTWIDGQLGRAQRLANLEALKRSPGFLVRNQSSLAGTTVRLTAQFHSVARSGNHLLVHLTVSDSTEGPIPVVVSMGGTAELKQFLGYKRGASVEAEITLQKFPVEEVNYPKRSNGQPTPVETAAKSPGFVPPIYNVAPVDPLTGWAALTATGHQLQLQGDPSSLITTDGLSRPTASVGGLVTPDVAHADSDAVGKEVVWSGILSQVRVQDGQTHILVAISGESLFGLKSFETFATDPDFVDELVDYREAYGSKDQGDAVSVTGVVRAADAAKVRLQSGVPLVEIRQIQREGDPRSQAIVGQKRDPSTLRAGGIADRLSVVLRKKVAPGTVVRFVAEFTAYQTSNQAVVVNPKVIRYSGAQILFPTSNGSMFADYRTGDLVEVTAALGEQPDQPGVTLKLTGKAIVRKANPRSLVTDQGREIPALDFKEEKRRLETARSYGNRDGKASENLLGCGLFNGSTKGDSHYTIKIEKLWLDTVYSLQLLCDADAEASLFLEQLQNGEEVLFEFFVVKKVAQTTYHLRWMSRIGEPDKKATFPTAEVQ